MNAPAVAPNSRALPADPALRDALMALVGFGVRIARVAADVAEVQGRVIALVAAELPADLAAAGSLQEARDAGLAVDSAEEALSAVSPRIEAAGRVFDRVSRSVRRTVALVQRLDTGWLPRGGGPDDRLAMARRQVARSVGEAIAQHATGEVAERLFDDLDDRLDAAALDGLLDGPVEEVVAAICRELGLVWPGGEVDGRGVTVGRGRGVPDG